MHCGGRGTGKIVFKRFFTGPPNTPIHNNILPVDGTRADTLCGGWGVQFKTGPMGLNVRLHNTAVERPYGLHIPYRTTNSAPIFAPQNCADDFYRVPAKYNSSTFIIQFELLIARFGYKILRRVV